MGRLCEIISNKIRGYSDGNKITLIATQYYAQDDVICVLWTLEEDDRTNVDKFFNILHVYKHFCNFVFVGTLIDTMHSPAPLPQTITAKCQTLTT